MLQKFSGNKFEWNEDTSQFNEDYIKNCIEERDEGYFFQDDVQYPKKLHELHNGLPLLSERMKLQNVKTFVSNLNDKTEYVIYKRNLKQSLNHRLTLQKVRKIE